MIVEMAAKKKAEATIGLQGDDSVVTLEAEAGPADESVELTVEDEAEKPEPRPGDADYDWSAQYGDGVELYTHTFPDGTVVALKTFAGIFSKTWMYKIRNLRTDIDIELAAIDRASCDAARDVLAGLDDSEGDPIDDLWKAWIVGGSADGEKVLSAGE